ncbi:hypothetical protein [Pseudoduganella sp. UC29_71]|uniref:hypothetical protein n=1 Tax=Pseudoduganella sp. UC29_71 TaxID=3350174 RepID=UPI00366B12E8
MRSMQAVFRSLLLWLMLVAIPFQGVASAGMLLCAPGPVPSRAPDMKAGHDHAAMLAAAHADRVDSHAGHAHHGVAQPDAETQTQQTQQAQAGEPGAADGGHGAHSSHGPAKCGSTGACCVGAALAPALPGVPPAPAVSSQSIPFYSGRLPAVDLALPERPPQAA